MALRLNGCAPRAASRVPLTEYPCSHADGVAVKTAASRDARYSRRKIFFWYRNLAMPNVMSNPTTATTNSP